MQKTFFELFTIFLCAFLYLVLKWSYESFGAFSVIPAYYLISCLLALITPRPKPGVYNYNSGTFFLWMIHYSYFRVLKSTGFYLLLNLFPSLRYIYYKSYGANVSYGVTYSDNVLIKDPYLVTVENSVYIGANTIISAHMLTTNYLVLAPIHIASNVLIGPDVRIEPGNYIPTMTKILRGQTKKMFA